MKVRMEAKVILEREMIEITDDELKNMRENFLDSNIGLRLNEPEKILIEQ